jgi:GH25 family lysozyme M1 (1,4-beta-N-acetylmuramidase)
LREPRPVQRLRTTRFYVGRWFAREIGLTRASSLARVPLWLPAYVEGPPELPDAWDRWHVWQYSGNGRAPGVSTRCDLDVIRMQADLDASRGVEVVDAPVREVPRGVDRRADSGRGDR